MMQTTDHDDTINWLMQGDPAIAYQCSRDLLGQDRPDLRAHIATQGWGKAYLDARNPNGFWGEGFYTPRWACSHYVLLELVGMAFPPDHPEILPSIRAIHDSHHSVDGGIGDAPGCHKSDTCVTGMFLNYAAYFGLDNTRLSGVVDFLLRLQMSDGGFNCQKTRSGAHHSSLHSTTSVLEGFQSYLAVGHTHRRSEITRVAQQAREFILRHRFYKSDHTGQVISPEFLKLPYPTRWRYNILRGLEHFRAAGAPYDPRMADALQALRDLRRPQDGRWPRMAKFPGKVFFEMEPPRGASRWNTLLALRVLQRYDAAAL